MSIALGANRGRREESSLLTMCSRKGWVSFYEDHLGLNIPKVLNLSDGEDELRIFLICSNLNLGVALKP